MSYRDEDVPTWVYLVTIVLLLVFAGCLWLYYRDECRDICAPNRGAFIGQHCTCSPEGEK